MKRFAVIAFLALGCPPSPVTPVAPDADSAVVAVDAGSDVATPKFDAARKPDASVFPMDACGKACTVLQSFGCPEAKPTPGGVDCHALCLQTEAFPNVTLHPGAVAACLTLACVRKAGVACR